MLSPSDSPVTVRLLDSDEFPDLRFVWTIDRWIWSIQPDSSDDSGFVSIAGDSESDWPPSPPIQQLMVENRENQKVVLGVGMAGASHWSISFEIGNNRSIIVDNACKTNGDHYFIGSTFKNSNQISVTPLDSNVSLNAENQKVMTPTYSAAGVTIRWRFELSVAKSTETIQDQFKEQNDQIESC